MCTVTIRARIVGASRKSHDCDQCANTINPHDTHIYAYRYAERGDPPYGIRMCMECCATCGRTCGLDEKVVAVYTQWLVTAPREFLHGDPQFEAVRVGGRLDRCGQTAYLYLTGKWAGELVLTEPCKMEVVCG